MNEVDALDLVREAFWTVIVAASPAVGAAMIIGLAIALFQALTQVQEMTLDLHSKDPRHFPDAHRQRHFHRHSDHQLHPDRLRSYRAWLLGTPLLPWRGAFLLL